MYDSCMWIEHVDEEEATGSLARIYASYTRQWGGVDHIIKSMSLCPEAMPPFLGFYNRVMHGNGELSLRQREMVALTVSVLNECHY